jgi:hypothetical protein
MTLWLRVPIGHRLGVVLTAAGLISCSAGSGAGGIKPVSAGFKGRGIWPGREEGQVWWR